MIGEVDMQYDQYECCNMNRGAKNLRDVCFTCNSTVDGVYFNSFITWALHLVGFSPIKLLIYQAEALTIGWSAHGVYQYTP